MKGRYLMNVTRQTPACPGAARSSSGVIAIELVTLAAGEFITAGKAVGVFPPQRADQRRTLLLPGRRLAARGFVDGQRHWEIIEGRLSPGNVCNPRSGVAPDCG